VKNVFSFCESIFFFKGKHDSIAFFAMSRTLQRKKDSHESAFTGCFFFSRSKKKKNIPRKTGEKYRYR